MRDVPEFRYSRLALYAAASYIVLVVGVFAWTSAVTRPEYLGYEWFPLMMLAMPWTNNLGIVPGFIVNAGIIYLLGALASELVARFRRRSNSGR